MSTELVPLPAASPGLVVPSPETRLLHRPIGLLISTGAPKPDKGPGRPIDHFRFKEGALDQYKQHVDKAAEAYGAEPKVLDDLYFLAATPPEVLDIRLRCWSKAGLRGFGTTNYAAIPDEQVFLDRAWSFDDEFTFRPRKLSEVRPEDRADWQGEPIIGELNGPDDPRVKRLEINVEATLRICLPKVMGVGLDALYSTKSRHIAKSLYKSVWDHYRAFGTLLGYPFRLTIRPRKTERFDPEQRELVSATVFEVVLDTPFTFGDVLDAIRDRRAAIGMPERLALEAQARVAGQALGLPLPTEEVRTRDEPELVDRPSDAQLNRIAMLEREYGGDLSALLKGAYDVDSAEELSAERAAVYEATLTRLVDERAEPAAEGEVVSEGGDRGSWFEAQAEQAKRKPREGGA
jgi:hypothetical protein